MELRTMRPEDYDGCCALWLRCSGMGLNDRDDSREGIRRYLDRNPRTCFVAVEGGEIVGTILSGHDGRRGYIYHAAVAPSHRRRGIGGQLVRAALGAMAAEGVTKVALVAFGRNESGNRFWEEMGFSPRPDLVYRDHPLVEMVRIDT